ncbi:MAG TPA: outer membrane beta-barrel protein [Gemmatimonadaceae bacterium]
MPLGRLAAFACLLSIVAPPLGAQDPLPRAGFTIGFGLGGGTRGLDCSECEVDREEGGTAMLFIGGTVGPRLTVGGELNGWGKTTRNVEESVASVMAVAHFYPMVRRGFFLSGGAGLTSMAVNAGNEKFRTDGFGVQVGAGYDFRVGSGFSLSPYMQWVRGVAGDGEENGIDIGDANPDYLQVGLGFTWH